MKPDFPSLADEIAEALPIMNIKVAALTVSEKSSNTVSHFSYAPIFQGPHFLTKMLESNILYDNLFIDFLSV